MNLDENKILELSNKLENYKYIEELDELDTNNFIKYINIKNINENENENENNIKLKNGGCFLEIGRAHVWTPVTL